MHKQYNTNDAGYAATDAALRRALGRQECQWISVTAADNSYGSEVLLSICVGVIPSICSNLESDPVLPMQVVERILRGDSTGAKPSMVIAPLDSRRYLEQGTQQLVATLHTARYAINKSGWRFLCSDMLYNKKFLVKEGKAGILATEYCGLLSNIEHNGFTYAIRPMPMLGKIDLASVFFQKDKLAQEQTYFSKCSFSLRSSSNYCQTGATCSRCCWIDYIINFCNVFTHC